MAGWRQSHRWESYKLANGSSWIHLTWNCWECSWCYLAADSDWECCAIAKCWMILKANSQSYSQRCRAIVCNRISARKLNLIRCRVEGQQRALSSPWEGVGSGVAKCEAIKIAISCRGWVFESLGLSNNSASRAGDISRHCCKNKCWGGKSRNWTCIYPGYSEGCV